MTNNAKRRKSGTKFVPALCLAALFAIFTQTGAQAAEPTTSQPPRKPPFSSTLIQYQDWMSGQSVENWIKEIEKMKSAGVNSIVIQWLGYNTAKFYEGNFDSLNQALLTFADNNDMSVYLGLWFGDEFWSAGNNVDAEYFRVDANPQRAGKLVSETAKILGKISGYTTHPSFKGWYIPQEVWNQSYTTEEQNRLKACLKKICDLAKATHAGKILISPIFNPGIATPAKTTEVYKNVFAGTGITDVLVQDGAGAKQWDTEEKIRTNIPPYLAAYKAATHHAGAKFWCNIESFQGPPSGPFTPTAFERLKKQIELETPFADIDELQRPMIITFDFFHYMSPVHAGETLTARKALYDSYIQSFPNP